jgi:hypothetical protein
VTGRPPLPNFFIVGAGKAGTSSLHDYLGQRPQIYMSAVKEPAYFASEIRAENLSEQFQRHVQLQSRELPKRLSDGRPVKPLGWLAFEWEDYERLFQGVRGETAIGEASPIYLWSKTAGSDPGTAPRAGGTGRFRGTDTTSRWFDARRGRTPRCAPGK